MKAAFLTAINQPLTVKETPVPSVEAGKVLIKLRYAALNHRDLWIQRAWYKGGSAGVILGSDGAGVVVETGADVSHLSPGQEVVINPGLDWGDNPKVQQASFRVLGHPDPGTLAEYILIDASQVYARPQHLSLQEAAAIPLAGLTAYRALFTRGQFEQGQRVLITGIGGGVSQFLLQFAVAAGGQVYVTSSKAEKIDLAIQQGAKAGFNYKKDNWSTQALESVQGGFDLIIDSAAGEGFIQLVEVVKPGGTIVFFGGTAGPLPEIPAAKIYLKQLNLLATEMGTPQEFQAMLNFYQDHQLRPVIDKLFALEEINQAFQRMEEGAQLGKIVIKISD